MFQKLIGTGLAAALVASAGAAHADWMLNMQAPQNAMTAKIYDLHVAIMVICLVIFVVVFGAMFYAILKHRKSKGHQAAQFHENTVIEVLWTLIPFLILMGIAYPAARVVLEQKNTLEPDMTIKITGYQWKWGYDYPKEGLSVFSMLKTPADEIRGREAKGEHYLLEVDHPLVVPTGKKIRALITSNDVMHGWYVPSLGVQQDAVPGFINDFWFKVDKPGVYRGQCAQICGKDHGFMPIVVEAKSPADYDAWVKAQQAKTAAAGLDPNKTYSLDELKKHGEAVYKNSCAACHQANGQGIPGTFPSLAGSKIATGPKEGHIRQVLFGKNAMPPFGPQLSDLDVAAVVTYERNSFGNKMGDAVQAADVKALRK